MAVHLLSNVRAVAADRVPDDATVASEDGRIVEVEENRSYVGAIDGRGAFCLPGLVDSHCDAIEREVSPRRRSASIWASPCGRWRPSSWPPGSPRPATA
jgi:alpha-D-ribose 1-methylphosphonate 5-triphosphate diphosphatase